MDENRSLYAFNFCICAILIGVAFYFNHIRHINPCPLCSLQVLCYYIIGVVSLVAFLHVPEKPGRYFYAILFLIITLLGISFAGRQLWLQSLPLGNMRVCESHLSVLVSNLGLNELMQALFYKGDECTPVLWTFMGLKMAVWSLIFFVILTLSSLRLLLRAIKD